MIKSSDKSTVYIKLLPLWFKFIENKLHFDIPTKCNIIITKFNKLDGGSTVVGVKGHTFCKGQKNKIETFSMDMILARFGIWKI